MHNALYMRNFHNNICSTITLSHNGQLLLAGLTPTRNKTKNVGLDGEKKFRKQMITQCRRQCHIYGADESAVVHEPEHNNSPETAKIRRDVNCSRVSQKLK